MSVSGIRASGTNAGGMPIRVLVIDHDAPGRTRIERALRAADVVTFGAAGGAEALRFLDEGGSVDVVLLTWDLTGMAGLEVLRHIRERGLRIPVIMLTQAADGVDEDAALEFGRVDFIDRSRSISLLLQRIRLAAAIAHTPVDRTASGDNALPGAAAAVVGRLQLDPSVRRAYWDGRQVDLTLTEFKIVELLIRQYDKDVSYRRIYDLAHGPGFIAGDGADGYRVNVRSFIKRIRNKFREIDPEFDHIKNYPGFGYRWHR